MQWALNQRRHLQQALGAGDVSLLADVHVNGDPLAHPTGRQVHQHDPRINLQRRQRPDLDGQQGEVCAVLPQEHAPCLPLALPQS